MRRAVVIDDSATVRLLTRLALEDDLDTEVVGEASDTEAAYVLIDRLRPDVAIIDINLPGAGGVALIRLLRQRCPGVRLVAHSGDEPGLAEALSGGADAAVLKNPMCAGLGSAIAS